MNESKHTPGPWYAKGEDIWNADEKMYGIARNFSAISPSQTTRANAALIAAAPDMYEALQELSQLTADYYSEKVHTPEYAFARIMTARAALAKAEGR